YRLTLVDMEMSEEGVLRRVPAAENSAGGVLKLSPREVVLEPGSSQRIKVAAYFPPGTAERELRSHLAFEPIALPKVASPVEPNPGLRLSLEVRSIVSIPVTAQHGRLSAAVSMSEASITQDQEGWVARVKLSRTGNRSVRGDLVVTFTPAGGAKTILIGEITALPV